MLSPLLSNIYLNPLDHLMAWPGLRDDALRRRFRDPMPKPARKRGGIGGGATMDGRGRPDVCTRPKPRSSTSMTEGFEFPGLSLLDLEAIVASDAAGKSSGQKFKDTIRAKTRRTDGRSLSTIIADINLGTLRGWFGYFKHSYPRRSASWTAGPPAPAEHSSQACGATRQSGRPRSNQRWPNAYFTEHGLFSLQTAYALARQSSSR